MNNGIRIGVVLSWLWCFWLLSAGCQKLEEPVCQPCETSLHCAENEVCFGRFNLCIPKGTCYCTEGEDSCESLLCEDSGGTCYHSSNQPAGTCGKAKTCNTDSDCPERMLCSTNSKGANVCQFTFLCNLPKECNNGDTRECMTNRPGNCSKGLQTCQSGRWSSCVPTAAQKEVCNGKDDNCDGKIDNGLVCVITVAGVAGSGDHVDGNKETARFDSPRGVATDSAGNIFVADTRNHCVRKIDATGKVTTFVGSGVAGTKDGMSTSAAFHSPIGLVIDRQNNLYIADSENHRIRKVTSSGKVTTLAGGIRGNTDGIGEKASFNRPIGIAIDKQGNLYVADSENHSIRKITPGGKVTTIAGSGQAGLRDGKAMQAQFNSPRGLAWAEDGSLYIADSASHLIRWLDEFGQVRTLAGSFQKNDWVDDTGSRARFNSPAAMFLESGFLWVADIDNHSIRRVNLQGRVETFAGKGSSGLKDGDASDAQFRFPWGIARDPNGRIIVADTDNNCIRAIVTYPR